MRYVFLDRDGTLVHDPGYVHRIEDYALLPGVVPALVRLRDAGFRFAVVTNQSGIGRGLYTVEQFWRFQQHLAADLARAGIAIDATYVCPHLPAAGCGCRKPAPDALLRARDELGADLARSWMIGDHASDVACGVRAGARGILVLTGHGAAERAKLPAAAEHPVVDDLETAARHILEAAAPAEHAWYGLLGPAPRATERPTLSEVAEGLLVGSYPLPGDVPWLRAAHGVTAVVSLQDDADLAAKGLRPAGLEHAYRTHGVAFHRVPVTDGDAGGLAARLVDIAALLARLLGAGERVFVHCNAGLNRAPTAAIAYPHAHGGLPLAEAVARVKARRSCVPYVTALEVAFGRRTAP